MTSKTNTVPSSFEILGETFDTETRYEDGSYLASSEAGQRLVTISEQIVPLATSAATAVVKGDLESRKVAYLLHDGMSCFLKDGRRVFARKNLPAAYKVWEDAVFGAAVPIPESPASKKIDATDKQTAFRNAVKRQLSNSRVTDDVIVKYAVSNLEEPLTDEERAAMPPVKSPGGVSLPEIDDMPDRLKDVLLAVYAENDLKLPVAFGGTKGKAKGSGGGSQGSGQAKTQADAVSLLTQTTESGTYGVDQASEDVATFALSIARTVWALTHASKGHSFPRAEVTNNLYSAIEYLTVAIDLTNDEGHDRDASASLLGLTETADRLTAMLAGNLTPAESIPETTTA